MQNPINSFGPPLPKVSSVPSSDYGTFNDLSLGTFSITRSCAHRWPLLFKSRPSRGSGRVYGKCKSFLRTFAAIFSKLFKEKEILQKIFVTLLIVLATSGPSVLGQITQSVEGKKQPLWEGGVALVGALVPAYPGSEDSNFFTLPFPAFFYRGDVLRADEEGGMRGRFFKSSNLEVNLSIGGSLPANSDDVAIRSGMPDLKTMLEVGPGILSTLWRKKGDFNAKLGLNIPVRTAWTVDFFEAKERGIVFNPLLYLITENLFADGLLSFTGISTVIASQKFHKVFYQVDPQFQRIDRNAYSADSGYLGTTISQGFARTLFKDTRAFIGGSYNYYKGSSNENSPLFRRKDNFSVAIGLVWWFYESSSLESN